MSDLFGLLEFPAPVPATDAALTDPALDLLLDFCKTVLNADLGDAWAAVAPADPLPVAFVFNHDPDLEDFNTNELPALYLWRADDIGSVARMSQDLVSDDAGFHGLWVPPPATYENRRARAGMMNGLRKSLKAAIGQGRHPAWVVAGDTYYQPEDYGSVLLHHTNFARARFGQTRAHKLVIADPDGQGKTSFDCIFFTIETLETFTKDTSPAVAGAGYSDLAAAESTTTLPSADGLNDGNALTAGTAHVEMTVVSIDVATGPAAGGTTVTITGTQFIEGMSVAFGDVDSLLVEYVDESTITALSPEQSAGVVDITVTQATGGVSKTLTAAFTYV